MTSFSLSPRYNEYAHSLEPSLWLAIALGHNWIHVLVIQCPKGLLRNITFHVLTDFDEGRRSCRRKLERHNNRRRRKSSDPKGSDDKSEKGVKSTATSEAAGEESFEACEGNNSVQGPTNAQTICRDSITSLAGHDTHTDEAREINGDDNTDFSSMCPTGRISFKLYDWNPAEFPHRLRHQIFQWLASMPVELEGYIRPGCTILTIFIVMPKFMWVKLNEDPVVCIYDLLALPKNMLLRRDRFYINLNSMIFSVMKEGFITFNTLSLIESFCHEARFESAYIFIHVGILLEIPLASYSLTVGRWLNQFLDFVILHGSLMPFV
ncbi:SBP-like protein [Tanacetum coccineum]|uniref:SBP-like protein n=1 Tax=Tanacetum coccineum TaxID=301880 RepID=A0ABQ5CTS6_9ASTR